MPAHVQKLNIANGTCIHSTLPEELILIQMPVLAPQPQSLPSLSGGELSRRKQFGPKLSEEGEIWLVSCTK